MARIGIIAKIRQVVKHLRKRGKAIHKYVSLRLNQVRPRWLGGAGLWDFLVFFWEGFTDRRFTLKAMGMSYRFFFALFPALILILTVVPYIPIDNLQEEVMDFLGTVVPGDSMGFIGRVVGEFFDKPSASVIYINIALLLYASTSGIKAMMYAFSKDNELFTKRNILRLNAVAMLILIVLLFLFLFMLGLLISGEYLIGWLTTNDYIHGSFESGILRFFHWIIVLAGLEIAFSVLYYLGPETEERWKFFSVGSLAAGVMSLAAVTAFRLFFTQFANYNKIYGSIGALMILMVWFYWMSTVLLIGFELNAAIAAAKFNHGLKMREESTEDETDE